MSQWFRAALLVGLVGLSGPALAQSDAAASYPNKPIRLIVGFGAGGGTDLMARIAGSKLAEVLGQPVVIENRTGAGGKIAIEYVQSQPADGYTLAYGAIGQLAVASAINPSLPIHPTRALIPVAMVSSYAMMIVTQQNDAIKSVPDLVAYAKANPDKANYPSTSPTFTISTELLKLKTGMPGQLVPYRSSNEMMLSLIGGQTLYVIADVPSVLPHAQSGKVRGLAVAQSSRLPQLPDVPTLAEIGFADLDIKPQWNGVFAAVGTPAAIVHKLEAALRKVTEDPAIRERMQAASYSAESIGSQAFRARIDDDIKAFSETIRTANLKFEQ